MATAAALKTDFLADEERSSRRHRLWLGARVLARDDADQVLIHNLSATGLLFESGLDLDLGDKIEVELPEAGTTPAEVVWCSGNFYGCEFASPVMAAAVSASRLRSPSPQPASALVGPTDEQEHDQDQTFSFAADPDALSPLQKTSVIFGLAVACWTPIIAAVAYF